MRYRREGGDLALLAPARPLRRIQRPLQLHDPLALRGTMKSHAPRSARSACVRVLVELVELLVSVSFHGHARSSSTIRSLCACVCVCLRARVFVCVKA